MNPPQLTDAALTVEDRVALLTFKRAGSARASDSNSDRKLDKLQFGQWSGMLDYDGSATPLAQPATFDGVRM